jgi:hypothetical protein
MVDGNDVVSVEVEVVVVVVVLFEMQLDVSSHVQPPTDRIRIPKAMPLHMPWPQMCKSLPRPNRVLYTKVPWGREQSD